MKKILIIEDDRALGEGIALGLGTNTYEFTRCETLKEQRKHGRRRHLIWLFWI